MTISRPAWWAQVGQFLTENLPGEELATDPVWVPVELISNSGLPVDICSSRVSLRVIDALNDGIASVL